MKKTLGILLLSVLSAAALYFLLFRSPGSPFPPPAPGKNGAKGPGKASPSPSPQAGRRAEGGKRIPVPSRPGKITLLVLERSGKTAAGALVMAGPKKCRSLERHARLLGKTKKDGSFTILEKEVDTSRESILVKKKGYLPAVVQNPELGKDYFLTLLPGHTLTLRFKTLFNKPLKGIEAWVSGRMFLPEDLAIGGRPWSPYEGRLRPETLIRYGKSNEEGVIRFDGLPAGTFHLRVLSPGYAYVDRNPPPPLVIPCGGITFTMAPLYAVSIKVRSDKFEDASTVLSSGNLFGGGTPWSDEQCRFWKNRLQQAGADYSVVSPILEGWKGDEPETVGKVPVFLLLAKRGWIKRSFTIRRLKPGFQPEIFDAKEIPEDPSMGKIRISIVNPDGTLLPYSRIPKKDKPFFWLEPANPKEKKRGLRSFSCYPDETKWAPSGKYRFYLPENTVPLFFRKTQNFVEVKAGKTVHRKVVLKVPLAPFRLDIRARDTSARLRFGIVEIHGGGISTSSITAGGLATVVFFAPVGPCLIVVSSPPYKKIEIQHTFTAPDVSRITTLHAVAVER